MALLITGSGQQDRDETILGHKPILVLADTLTRKGIAVLRVDDRGVGGSTGDATQATSADFADDARASLAYLKGRKEIDPRRTGLIGHSEGALIAGMLAARNPDLAFVVLLAGAGVPGGELIVQQVAELTRAQGAPAAQVEANANRQRQLMDVIRQTPDDGAAAVQLRALLADQPGMDGQALDAAIQGMLSPWYRYFVTYDPRPDLRLVRSPVLAIGGGKDRQVPAEANLQAIRQALDAGGNRDVTTRMLPGLNHLLQTADTGLPNEYATIAETLAPEALAMISAWVVERTRQR